MSRRLNTCPRWSNRITADATELARTLEGFLASTGPPKEKKTWLHVLRRNPAEKVAALILAVLLWFFFVHESEVVYRSFRVKPGEYPGLAAELAVESIRPSTVEVILSGPRRSFYFVDAEDIELTTKLFEAGTGEQEVLLTAPDVAFPPGLTFVNIIPRSLRVTIAAAPPAAEDQERGR